MHVSRKSTAPTWATPKPYIPRLYHLSVAVGLGSLRNESYQGLIQKIYKVGG